MQSSCKTDDQSTDPSLAPFFITCSSLWNSTEHPKYSPSKSTCTEQELSPENFHHVKQSDSRFQEQDTSSTLSTCQSHYGMADAARNRPSVQNIGSQCGSDESYGKSGGQYQRSSLLYGNEDYGFGQVALNYNMSGQACITFPSTESYFGGLVAAYGQSAFIYPPMVGLTPARVAIPPLECAESIPILVNAKQFRAIVRRRQIRAKLEAQNKILKSRRPYLHQSRHVHALKRARGPGGRFLNSKDIKQSHHSSPSCCKDISDKKFNGGDVPGSEAQHSASGSRGSSTLSRSDVTSIFNGDDMFQQLEFRVPTTTSSSFRMHLPVRGELTRLEAGDRLLLSIDGRAQK